MGSVILRFLHIMTWLSIILTIVLISNSVSGLGCYNCITQNRSVQSCEDNPFNGDFAESEGLKHESCKVASSEKGNGTLVDAEKCIKIIATVRKTKETVIIRGCGSRDVESLCGNFKFKGERMKGCLLSCDHDFCNSGSLFYTSTTLILLSSLTAVFTFLLQNY